METPADPARASSASRRRGGRPALPDAERRGRFVGFWITPTEQAQLGAAALAAGSLSVSAYLRTMAIDAQARPARRHSRQADPETGLIVAQLQRIGNNLNQVLLEARRGHFPPSTEAAANDALDAMTAYLLSLAPDDPET